MNNPIIYYVIGGLLFVFFCFLTYKFVATWRVWHILTMFFLFLAVVAMCVMVALSYRTHHTWRTQAFALGQQLVKEVSSNEEVRYGNPIELVQSNPSIRSVNADEQRALMNRGRVWRGCMPAQAADDDTVTVSTPAPPAAAAAASAAAPAPAAAPAAPGAAAPAPAAPAPKPAVAAEPAIQQNMILQVFVEEDAAPEDKLPPGSKLPKYYVGEFTVTAVTENSAALRPTRPLDAISKQTMRQPGKSWVLYETMPVDSHRAFAADQKKSPDLTRNADEEPVFGKMEAERMKLLLVEPKQPSPVTADQFKKTVDSYLRDGKRATQDDPPQNTWLKVRFTQPYKEDVDTVGESVGAVTSSQTFYDRGRAEIALLRRGKPVEFNKGDVGVFPQEDGKRLIGQKVCELIEPVYVRELNDYEFGLRNLALLTAQLEKNQTQLLRDKAEVDRANQLALEEIKAREDERGKLNTDVEKTRLEQKRMTDYVATLEERSAKMREELSNLYRINSELVDQLATLDREMTERINRTTAAAVGVSE